jgi:hypothetical protein
VRQYAAQAQHELTQQQRLQEAFGLVCARLGFSELVAPGGLPLTEFDASESLAS